MSGHGILVDSSDNLIAGCHIVGNQGNGILIATDQFFNVIGGPTAAERNILEKHQFPAAVIDFPALPRNAAAA